jgi:hypothetical protein
MGFPTERLDATTHIEDSFRATSRVTRGLDAFGSMIMIVIIHVSAILSYT